jgi:gamma-glutamyl hercynylcysteine S-oxide synthase
MPMLPLPLPLPHARTADAAALALALGDARHHTLATMQSWRNTLGEAMAVPLDDTFNPPRWELAHVAWFESWWIARNPEHHLGTQANPVAPRTPAPQMQPDAWLDSSRMAHRARWTLDLPSLEQLLAQAAEQREATLHALHNAAPTDQGLYFHRLVLMHELMHNEAWLMMSQAMGVAVASPPRAPTPAAVTTQELAVPATTLPLGQARDAAGFHFDNEWGTRLEPLPAFSIDAAPVSWQRYIPFIEAGGYDARTHWSDAGWAWRSQRSARAPRHLRATADGAWQEQRFGVWADVLPHEAASHLTFHEAQAWCVWAGRHLATEAQWRAAEHRHGDRMIWGDVWEWTATPFAPFDGFTPHPYRDYSQPWFDGRPVLKGASRFTHPGMRHPAYRNFFKAERDDVRAGFRSAV